MTDAVLGGETDPVALCYAYFNGATLGGIFSTLLCRSLVYIATGGAGASLLQAALGVALTNEAAQSFNGALDSFANGNYVQGIHRTILSFLSSSGAAKFWGGAYYTLVNNNQLPGNTQTRTNSSVYKPQGKLTGSLDGLTTDEHNMVNDLINPRSIKPNVKTPDFRVDGILTELKTLKGTSLNTPVTRIQNGFSQHAQTVIIDGRQSGLTIEQAITVIRRARGTFGGVLPGTVEIWTQKGVVKVNG